MTDTLYGIWPSATAETVLRNMGVPEFSAAQMSDPVTLGLTETKLSYPLTNRGHVLTCLDPTQPGMVMVYTQN